MTKILKNIYDPAPNWTQSDYKILNRALDKFITDYQIAQIFPNYSLVDPPKNIANTKNPKYYKRFTISNGRPNAMHDVHPNLDGATTFIRTGVIKMNAENKEYEHAIHLRFIPNFYHVGSNTQIPPQFYLYGCEFHRNEYLKVYNKFLNHLSENMADQEALNNPIPIARQRPKDIDQMIIRGEIPCNCYGQTADLLPDIRRQEQENIGTMF